MRGTRTPVLPNSTVGKPLASYTESDFDDIRNMEHDGKSPEPATNNPVPRVPLMNFRRE
jgi:hypothetical protein